MKKVKKSEKLQKVKKFKKNIFHGSERRNEYP